jgi:hypothetical protein
MFMFLDSRREDKCSCIKLRGHVSQQYTTVVLPALVDTESQISTARLQQFSTVPLFRLFQVAWHAQCSYLVCMEKAWLPAGLVPAPKGA